MIQLTSITTGTTIQLGSERTATARRIILAHGGTPGVSTNPQRPFPDHRLYSLHIMAVLAVWGIHHSNETISSRSLQARIGFGHQVVGRLLRSFTNAGWIEPSGKVVDASKGRVPVAYKLTRQGVAATHSWFMRLFQGSRVTGEFTDQQQAERALNDLRAQRGIIVANGIQRTLVPYDGSALVLMLSWILEQAGEAINAPDISDRLRCDDSSVHGILPTLKQRGLIVASEARARQGKSGPKAHRFQLSDGASQLAHQYLVSLLT